MKKNHKNIELISRFKYAQKISPLKKFYRYFLTHLKTAQIVASLIIRKWKIFAGLQIHPKTVLTCTNKVRKACR